MVTIVKVINISHDNKGMKIIRAIRYPQLTITHPPHEYCDIYGRFVETLARL